jgi:hypothetical protein
MFGFFLPEYLLYRFDGWFREEVVVRFLLKVYCVVVIDTVYLCYVVVSGVVGFKIGVIFFV